MDGGRDAGQRRGGVLVSGLVRAGDLAHSRTRRFARRVEQARRIIEATVGHDDLPWCVAFSGGKDSTVLLDIVETVRPGLTVAFLDDGWDYPETLVFVAESERRIGRAILRIVVPTESPYASPAENRFWREWGDPGLDPDADHPSDMEFSAWQRGWHSLTGVRAEESSTRGVHLRSHGALYYSGTWGHWVCCPLAAWGVDDIWAYIVSRDLPYNPVYDRLGALGMGRERQRVNSIVSAAGFPLGSISWLRMGWPDLFNRFRFHTGLNGEML